MAYSASELSKQDFFHSYLGEYLDGELPANLKAEFDKELSVPGQQDVPGLFGQLRGRLQLNVQSIYLKEHELSELRAIVQDPSTLATEEATRIAELEKKEFLSTWLRRIALTAVAAGLAGALWWKYGMSHDQKFKPLEYLGYEATALESNSRERINLPSTDIKEVRQYLSQYPGLSFTPKALSQVPSPWQVSGATVIDYEVAKVVVVTYVIEEAGKVRDRLTHFSFAGKLSDLPTAEPGNMRGLIFQTYTTEELNFVAWESQPGVVSILVGRRSAPELAEIAVSGK
jgi:hypothetical protein